MSDIRFEVNNSKLKLRNEFFNDENLNNLVDGLLKNQSWGIFIDDIKDFFNARNFKVLSRLIKSKYVAYADNYYLNIYLDDFNIIISYFYSFEDIYKNNKVGSLKGTFLELFAYKYLKLKYPDSNLYRECRMFHGKFTSPLLLDAVAELENNEIKIFECKFSKRGFERSYLDNLYGISKVCPLCEIFVLTMEEYDDFNNHLYTLKKNTSLKKFDKLVGSIEILSLECFDKGYFVI